MADVRFWQGQELFDAEPYERWARLIVYEDEYADCMESGSPFLFEITWPDRFMEQEKILVIGQEKIPVGISNCDEESTYDAHKETIEKLLGEEIQKVDVVLYTTSNRFKEAFYHDFQHTMQLNSKITDEKEIMYWSYCGKNDSVLLVAFEGLSSYRECKQYLDENFYGHSD